ncbi:hypothetical protein OG252_20510 [Streptomyces sp. NBC_01352]|uniref:hypothetical protein n=1 Tax=Streptomyces sp. NBC_01352 TaxID=2903834 RepID=UPI002E324A5E|nr:hypothetical protein [Streptomyces sp. NBC_01352]
MADEHYRWLDRETAERLLSGESLDAVDAADRDQAERLAKTLGALSVDSPAGAELPGEAAALAAFRKARTDRVDDWVGDRAVDDSGARASRDRRSRPRSSDAGLVRIGGPDPDAPRRRRTRPVRLGLAAALAVGMAGGVAFAAGTGALPFKDSEPEPAASVSAAVTPDRPLVTPSPKGPQSEPTPDGATGDTGQGSSRDTARGGSATPDDGSQTGTGNGADGQEGRSGGEWSGAVSACSAVRDGERLSSERRRALEGAAGGSAKVWKYCAGVLASGSSEEDAHSDGKGGTGEQNGQDGQEDNEVKGDRDDGDGRNPGEGYTGGDNGTGGNGHHANGGLATPSAVASLEPEPATPSPGSTPSPTYSAL